MFAQKMFDNLTYHHIFSVGFDLTEFIEWFACCCVFNSMEPYICVHVALHAHQLI